jgi:hypothetical protein
MANYGTICATHNDPEMQAVWPSCGGIQSTIPSPAPLPNGSQALLEDECKFINLPSLPLSLSEEKVTIG